MSSGLGYERTEKEDEVCPETDGTREVTVLFIYTLPSRQGVPTSGATKRPNVRISTRRRLNCVACND